MNIYLRRVINKSRSYRFENDLSGFMDQVFLNIKTIWDSAKKTIDTVLDQISSSVTYGWKNIVFTIKSALKNIKTIISTP